MLRVGTVVLSVQKLMRHADLKLLSWYLVQITTDIAKAHRQGRPIDIASFSMKFNFL
jgi:hypothetical protein